MNSAELIEKIKYMIKHSRTEEALDLLGNFISNKDKKLHNEILMYKSDLIKTNNAFSKGFVEYKDVIKAVNNINSLILNDVLEKISNLVEELNENNDSPRLRVVVAIVQKDKKFLLTERRNKEGSFSWGFPAGMIKPSKSERDVVVEECFEETNILIQPVLRLGDRIHPNTKVLISYWLCEYIEGEIQNKDTKELSDIRWVSAREALELITSDIFTPLKEFLINSIPATKISVGIVAHGYSVLLVKRANKEGDLQWQFPAGKIEPLEEASMACEREVYEETNIICKARVKIGERMHPQTYVYIEYWGCDYVSGEAIVKDNEELSDVMWCPIEKINAYITSDIFDPVLEYLWSK